MIKSNGKSPVSRSLSSTVHYWPWTSATDHSLCGLRFWESRSLMLKCMFSQPRCHCVCHRQSAGVAFYTWKPSSASGTESAGLISHVCCVHGTGEPSSIILHSAIVTGMITLACPLIYGLFSLNRLFSLYHICPQY